MDTARNFAKAMVEDSTGDGYLALDGTRGRHR